MIINSQRGLYHIEREIENQDAVYFLENGEWQICAVADGISNCSCSGPGARLAVVTACEVLMENPDIYINPKNRSCLDIVLKKVKKAICGLAYINKNLEDAYACTLLCLLRNTLTGELLILNRGDSMAIGAASEGICFLNQPDPDDIGCPSVVDSHPVWTSVEYVSGSEAMRLDQIILMSDGVWKTLFRCGALSPDVFSLIRKQGLTDELDTWLGSHHIIDDYSYLLLETRIHHDRS